MTVDISQFMKYIRSSVGKMDGLLSGLLEVSRLGRVRPRTEKLDMNWLMGAVMDSFRFRLRTEKVKTEVADLPECSGDLQQINMLFSNLIDNAIKYMDPERKGEISVSGWTENGRAVYCVKDNGIGIAPKYQEKIFDLFHQVGPDRASGEGLGLYIIRRILDAHGGSIHVESEPGVGSKFCVSLPGA
jgi:signal transduction histidine kinase